MKKSLLLLSILLPFLYGGAVLAGDPQKGVRVRAERGDATDQFDLGMMYLRGRGVGEDYKVALKWITLAALQGDGEAQNRLGLMYLKGFGTPRDGKVAVKWMTQAAKQGNVAAQANLGQLYATHMFGVSRDYKLAVKWATLAAKQGRAEAQVVLGRMYYGGKAVRQDNMRAHMWFSLAASDARTSTHSLRRMMAKKMSSAYMAKAEKLARECLDSNYQTC